MDYIDVGKVDSALRYSPPPKTEFVKTGFPYHLVAVPACSMMYGPDGKLIENKLIGSHLWQIQGSPGPPGRPVNTAPVGAGNAQQKHGSSDQEQCRSDVSRIDE